MSLIKNSIKDAAIKLVKANRPDAIMKTQQTTLEQVVKGRTN
jgi:hypothetical protein